MASLDSMMTRREPLAAAPLLGLPQLPAIEDKTPQPAEGGADHRDEIDAVAQKMLRRAGKVGEVAHDDGDEESSPESGEPRTVAKPTKEKGHKGKKGKKPAKHVPNIAKVEKPAKRVPKSAEWPTPPSIGWEKSRFQVMCRSGKGGPGSSHAILFEGNGGPKGARAKAEDWLREKMAQYKKHHKAG